MRIDFNPRPGMVAQGIDLATEALGVGERPPLDIETAEVFYPLLEPARYKGAHGGRGSAKSHFFAELDVEDHYENPGMRSVCIREVQKSLKESAKRLIEDKIRKHGLQDRGFRILNDYIETPGGGIIIFVGMADHNAESIKSLEGFDRAWVEEAHTLSARSLMLLRPTIRNMASELWFSWNPRHKRDPVDELFRGEITMKDMVCVEANWRDNPWFPQELEDERQSDLEKYPDSYDHVWEGGYVTAQEGAYFTKHINKAKKEGRICRVARDYLMSVYAFWDIGGTGAKADACSIWMVQFIGKEIRVIDYYEAQGQELSEHVGWLRREDYEGAVCYLPHDGVKHDSVHRVTFESELKKARFKVKILKNAGPGAANQRIGAVRTIFPRVWLDSVKCAPGLEALGWYHEKKDDHRNIGLGPEHDWSSHAADGFGAMALEADKLSKAITKRKAGFANIKGYSP
jgi:phage terminase large subunit